MRTGKVNPDSNDSLGFVYNYVVVFSFFSARPKQDANYSKLQVTWQRLEVRVSVNHTTDQPDESARNLGRQEHTMPQTK